MFDSSIPVFTQFLTALSAILKKAEAYCEAKKIDSDAPLAARLFRDMFPLRRQVQLACDFAKGGGARLAGVPVPSFPEEEKTCAELQAGIAKTLDLPHTLKKDHVADADARTVT